MNKNDCALLCSRSIEIYGGIGGQLLMNFEVDPSEDISFERPPAPDDGFGLYKCLYCGASHKEFHSNCPNCTAPMDLRSRI